MFKKSTYLHEVLETHRMAHVKELMEVYVAKRSQVKEALEAKYADKIASSAINSGSYAKFTAINVKFDIDLCQPFQRNSFDTLKEMCMELFRFFDEEYRQTDKELIEVRTPDVSVGLTFKIGTDFIEMDVVPGRELNAGDYLKTNDLNLYLTPDEQNRIKTNIQKHIEHIKGKSEERNIIRLLKVWKYRKSKQVQSFFIELITIKAFESCKEIPSNLWEQLKMTMEFIRDKVETISLPDPANSNNIVSDSLTIDEKKKLADEMKKMLADIEKNEQMLTFYFPCNVKYSDKLKESIATTIKKENHKPYAF